MSADGSGPRYKYQRLRERIRNDIISGALSGKLPGERRLADQYQADPKTVNKSLQELAKEGLLTRAVGKGTYVSVHLDSYIQPSTTQMVVWCVPGGSNAPGVTGDTAESEPRLQATHQASEGHFADDRTGPSAFSGEGDWGAYTHEPALTGRDGVSVACRACQELVTSEQCIFRPCVLKTPAGAAVTVSDLPQHYWHDATVVVLESLSASDELVTVLRANGTRVVLVNPPHNAPITGDMATVSTDLIHGGYVLGEHLFLLGHVSIGLVHDGQKPQDTTSHTYALGGVRTAAQRFSQDNDALDQVVSIGLNHDRTEPESLILRWRSQTPPGHGILCVGLNVTIRVLDCIRNLGWSVPRDVSLCTLLRPGEESDHRVQRLAIQYLPLTRYYTPSEALGRRVLDVLHNGMSGRGAHMAVVPGTLHVGRSSGPASGVA